MLKKLGVSLASILSIGSIIFAPAIAQAHVLKRQGPISMLLHINPNDAPQAHAPSQLLFIGANDNSVFNFSDYAVEVTVKDSGKLLLDKRIEPSAGAFNTIQVDYTFPSVGVFDLDIKAVPDKGAKVPGFDIDYPVRIDEIAPVLEQNRTLVVILASIGGLALILVFLRYVVGIKFKRLKRKAKNSIKSPKKAKPASKSTASP